jgi:MFS family permease
MTHPSQVTPTVAPAAMRGASRSLAILCLASFLTTLDRLAFPVLVEPIRREFHLSDTSVGLLTGLTFAIMFSLASIPVARWADRGNRRLIIALSLGIWSVMTAACGLAQNTWQLFAARLGGGLGEAGSVAPAQSLMADYYPPQRRSLPLSLFIFAATFGGIIGYSIIGITVERLGWRHALFAFALPGLLATSLIMVGVVEPRLKVTIQTGEAPRRVKLIEAIRELVSKRCAVHLIIGFSIWGFAGYGIAPWLPSFFIRNHGLTMTQLGVYFSFSGAGAAIGILVGGIFGNRFLSRDLRWGLWLPALGIGIYVPLQIVAFLVHSTNLAFTMYFFAAVVAGTVGSPILTIMSGLVRPEVRAFTLAIMGLLPVIIGSGFGPVAVGAASDFLEPRFGVESLRYSLVFAVLLMFWGAVHLYVASRYLLAEFEDRTFFSRSDSTSNVAG